MPTSPPPTATIRLDGCVTPSSGSSRSLRTEGTEGWSGSQPGGRSTRGAGSSRMSTFTQREREREIQFRGFLWPGGEPGGQPAEEEKAPMTSQKWIRSRARKVRGRFGEGSGKVRGRRHRRRLEVDPLVLKRHDERPQRRRVSEDRRVPVLEVRVRLDHAHDGGVHGRAVRVHLGRFEDGSRMVRGRFEEGSGGVRGELHLIGRAPHARTATRPPTARGHPTTSRRRPSRTGSRTRR